MSRHGVGKYIFKFSKCSLVTGHSGHLISIFVDVLLAMYLCRYLSRYLGRYVAQSLPGHQEGVMLDVLRWCLTLTRAQPQYHCIPVSLLHCRHL